MICLSIANEEKFQISRLGVWNLTPKLRTKQTKIIGKQNLIRKLEMKITFVMVVTRFGCWSCCLQPLESGGGRRCYHQQDPGSWSREPMAMIEEARWPRIGFRPARPPVAMVKADQQHRGQNGVGLVALSRLKRPWSAWAPTPAPPVVQSVRPRSKAEPTATLWGKSGAAFADMSCQLGMKHDTFKFTGN